MRFIGLDLSGLNSLAAIRDDSGETAFVAGALPERPTCVLLPLVRDEPIVAGDDALLSERGLGEDWPPLARVSGNSGRVLLADIWEELISEDHCARRFTPPDQLPEILRPAADRCLLAEVHAVVSRTRDVHASSDPQESIVLGVPNSLGEGGQELLLRGSLPGLRLIWRSMAVAMAWAEEHATELQPGVKLGVIDVGLRGIEVTPCEFRRDGGFWAPVRRPALSRRVKIDLAAATNDQRFRNISFDRSVLASERVLLREALAGCTHVVACGALGPQAAAELEDILKNGVEQASVGFVARGAALFAARLVGKQATYLDVLPSLELLVTNREHEYEWRAIIPASLEVRGGQDYTDRFPRVLAVRARTLQLDNWLRRDDRSRELRKLTTTLPRAPESSVTVDLTVAARSAGGFARLEIHPSDGESDVFGPTKRMVLDWSSMRIEEAPPSGLPIGTTFAWPGTGRLVGAWIAFDRFLKVGTRYLRDQSERSLTELDDAATAATPARLTPGEVDGVQPLRSLPCFGSDRPTQLAELDQSLVVRRTFVPDVGQIATIERIGETLRLELEERCRQGEQVQQLVVGQIVRILGRMARHSPDLFADWLLHRVARGNNNVLFAAGRVLVKPEHGEAFFAVIGRRPTLNANWLRAIDYLLYQRPEFLLRVPREVVVHAAKMTADILCDQVSDARFRVLWDLSVRSIARLLRARMYCSGFLTEQSENAYERSLFIHIQSLLERSENLLRQIVRQTAAVKQRTRLCRLTQEWLCASATTNVLGPPDEPVGEE